MKKMLVLLAFAGLFTISAFIPDHTDRIIAIVTFAVISVAFLLAASWDWLKDNWYSIKIVMLIPVFIPAYVIDLCKKRVARFKKVKKLTNEEELEVMINHFNEPLGIGA